jgi:hypothetical protein
MPAAGTTVGRRHGLSLIGESNQHYWRLCPCQCPRPLRVASRLSLTQGPGRPCSALASERELETWNPRFPIRPATGNGASRGRRVGDFGVWGQPTVAPGGRLPATLGGPGFRPGHVPGLRPTRPAGTSESPGHCQCLTDGATNGRRGGPVPADTGLPLTEWVARQKK